MKTDRQNPISNVPILRKYKIIKIPDPFIQKRNALLFRKFSISAPFHGMKIQNIETIFQNLASKTIFWIDCRQSEQHFQFSSRGLAGVLPPANILPQSYSWLQIVLGWEDPTGQQKCMSLFQGNVCCALCSGLMREYYMI